MHDRTDSQVQASALLMWANYVETGDVNLSAQDAVNCKKPFNALDSYQMRMVLRLRDLSASLLKQDVAGFLGSKAVPQATLAAPQEKVCKLQWSESEGGVLSLRIGKVLFAHIEKVGLFIDPAIEPKLFKASFLLTNIKTDQGSFADVESAKAHLERAALGWLKALEG